MKLDELYFLFIFLYVPVDTPADFIGSSEQVADNNRYVCKFHN